MTLLSQVLERARARRPLTGLRLGPAGKPELAEQNVAELFWASRIERLTGELLDFGLERAGTLREFARQTREHLAIDGDPAPLHAREHRNERPLQRLINAAHALGGNARFEHLPQPQRDVRALGGIFGGLLDLHAVEREPGSARAGELVQID